MTMLKIIALILSLGFLAGCAGNAEFSAYVKAHRAKYNQTAPHYAQLIKDFMPEDTEFQKAAKESKLKLIEAEGEMIKNAEDLLTGPK